MNCIDIFSGLRKYISDVLQSSFYNLSKILLKGSLKLIHGFFVIFNGYIF